MTINEQINGLSKLLSERCIFEKEEEELLNTILETLSKINKNEQ